MEDKSLGEYWLSCMTERYFNFRGRSSRREYWSFILIHSFVWLLYVLVFMGLNYGFDTGALPKNAFAKFMFFFMIGLAVYLFIPAFSANVRRLNDVGKSAWYLFLALFPPIGWTLLLYWRCLESKDGK